MFQARSQFDNLGIARSSAGTSATGSAVRPPDGAQSESPPPLVQSSNCAAVRGKLSTRSWPFEEDVTLVTSSCAALRLGPPEMKDPVGLGRAAGFGGLVLIVLLGAR